MTPISLLVCLLLASCADPKPLPPSATQPAARAIQSPDFAQLIATLASPEMEGRGPGTAGIEKARAFLESQYTAAGLLPAVHLPGRPVGFDEPFDIQMGLTVAEQSLVALTSDGHDHPLAHDKDFNPLGFSANGDFSGPAVFVGYAIESPAHHYDSFVGLPPGLGGLAGKVAVAFRFEPMAGPGQSAWGRDGGWTEDAALLPKALAAQRHGAVALVIVNPPSSNPPGRLTAHATSLPASIHIPVEYITTDCFHQLLKLSAVEPDKTLADFQKSADAGNAAPIPLNFTLAGSVKLEHKNAHIANIVGLLPGQAALAEHYIVIGAHYDHLGHGDRGSLYHPGPNDPVDAIHPGADDNASGSAGVVLIARELAAAVRDGSAPANRRSVLFIGFSGEEAGLFGSAYLADHLDDLALKSSQIDEMINLDMIGRMKDNTVFVTGETSAEPWKALVTQAGEGSGLLIVHQFILTGGSDHMSFLHHHIPAVHFFTGLHADYHRPTDTADKINVAGGVEIAHVAARLAQIIWAQPEPLAFNAQGVDVRGGVGKRGAFLGVQMDTDGPDTAGGCPVDGVVPGSPAAAAGLVPGDLITAVNDKKIASMRDLLAAMQSARPGQAVKITLQRGKETLTLTATLAKPN